MRRVFRYELHGDETVLELPEGASVLHVGAARGRHVDLWALVDESRPKQQRSFVVVGTGHVVPEAFTAFVGTAFMHLAPGAPLVFHVFERVTRRPMPEFD